MQWNWSGTQMGLAVALGAGLLIGLERERRKGQGDDREAAGLRTFMIAALAGAMAQLASSWLAVVVLAAVALLAALSYWRSRSRDPGLTTEVALVATVLIGVLAVSQAALAAGCAVVLAAVLAARERLHHFATEWLTEPEMHDGLLLSALVLVLLPLLPAEPVVWLGQLSPRRVLMLVIVILLMQACGHVAQRLLGVRSGLALSGLLGGFVSSTATISAMGGLHRRGLPLRMALCAAVFSMVATWLQLGLVASVVSATALLKVMPLVGVGAVAPLLLGLVLWRRKVKGTAAWLDEEARAVGEAQVLRIREALLVTALLTGGAVVVHLAQRFGGGGVLIGTALAAVADAHAPMVSLLSLHGAGRLSEGLLMQGLMVAIGVNGLTRTAVAASSGGARFGLGVGLALALNLLVALVWVGLTQA